ncbi:hypothetical protein [Vulgatibacter incomptus]|uniref:Uncharacterized protein n=1 Tax=Vulgatibacter incomptus TaxID=1391653 RepID=A0A0K1PDX2_9BACT|nr:hypothetical protein [Vulgatibacter incomptus]AKU91705.1 hypothetical protein AKJ08_2092 [Vulgatibacter incomptus]
MSDWAWRYPLGANLKGYLAHTVFGLATALSLSRERALVRR